MSYHNSTAGEKEEPREGRVRFLTGDSLLYKIQRSTGLPHLRPECGQAGCVGVGPFSLTILRVIYSGAGRPRRAQPE